MTRNKLYTMFVLVTLAVLILAPAAEAAHNAKSFKKTCKKLYCQRYNSKGQKVSGFFPIGSKVTFAKTVKIGRRYFYVTNSIAMGTRHYLASDWK